MYRHDIQLLLLPGLGGDSRMLYHQRPPAPYALPYKLICPDYLPARSGESLPDYSKRFLTFLLGRGSIDRHAPLMLAGVSLGGAIVQEMSRLIRTQGVILIGSLRNSSELAAPIRNFGKYLAEKIPDLTYRAAAPLIRFGISKFSQISEKDTKLCMRMYLEQPRKFFRRGFHMISTWNGCELDVPIFRIHGSNDHIIPFTETLGANVVVQDGKHLISMSNANEVNRAIIGFIDRSMRNNYSRVA